MVTLGKVDLNSDVGESYGTYTMGLDSEVLKYVTSANIACGWHAGDPVVMEQTIRTAVQEGVSVGAHPGFPDLMGFGRREIKITPEEAKAYVIYQIGALEAFARAAGISLRHVKAHGALYNMAAKDEKLAMAIAEAVKATNPELILMGLANSCLTKAGQQIGLKVAHEVFADRAYQVDGTLVARGQPGFMIEDPELAIRRVVKMVKEGKVEVVTGEEIRIQADSICVHGDSPKALEFVQKIRRALEEEEILVEAL